MPKILEVTNLNKTFGKFQALDNVSFTINQGEVFGLLGPNGAGKSVTIRSILGLLKRDSGQIDLLGQDATVNVLDSHKHIAYVPGDVFLWPTLTGGETIDLLLNMSGHKWNATTDRLIKVFQLDPKKKARTYSKGNRQKVALIAAFSADVDLYIFDEPTSGLDPLQELNFQAELMRLKAAGKTILLSSHILSEVEKVVDQLAIIRNGQIVDSGSLNEMQQLAKLNITATLPATASTTIFSQYDKFTQTGATITFSIQRAQLPAILTALSSQNIIDLQVNAPSLEELFMQYYGKEEWHDDK